MKSFGIKYLLSILIFFMFFSLEGFAWALVNGVWDISVNMKTTVSIPKQKKQTVQNFFTANWAYYDNGQFQMIHGVGGTWSQKRKKVTVNLDVQAIADSLSDSLVDYVGSVDVQVTKITFSGTENKNGSIKGTYKWDMKIFLYDYNVTGKVTVTGKYTGWLDRTPPSIPAGLVTETVSSSQINLSWSDNDSAENSVGYKIYRNGTQIADTADSSYKDTGLNADTQFCYSVAAYDVAGNESGQCNQLCKKTMPLPDIEAPSIPTSLSAIAISTTQINLSWYASTDNKGIVGYKIYRDGTYIKNSATISTSDTGLMPDTQYCYTVSAYDAVNNESGQSPPACAKTNSIDPILAKTELLKGKWHFIFTIITTFTYDYTLMTITGDKNDQGGYAIIGTDEWGGNVAAAYWPNDGIWALLDPGSIIDRFYVFYTDGSNILPNSCYYQITTSTGSWSRCYDLSGYKYSTSVSSNNVRTRNRVGAIILESIMKNAIEKAPAEEPLQHIYQDLRQRQN